MPKEKKKCPICNKNFYTYNQSQKTCSKKCMGLNQRGENNPNFGNKWSDEARKKLSDYQISIRDVISDRVKNEWDGNTERKKKLSELASARGKTRTGELNPFYNKKHSTETKKIISKKSSEKFTEEFKKKQRKIMEEIGAWRKLEDVSDAEIYYKEADWIDSMFDIVPNGLYMLNEHGVFNNLKNKKGAVRDHIYGRTEGFNNLVFPEILRHPCNCQILLNADNTAKGQKIQKGKGRTDSDITLDELFKRIKSYNGKWKEHDLVLTLIKKYERGSRWARKEVVR